MARTTNPKTLAKIIETLRRDRQQLVTRLAAIDETFTSLRISPDGGTGERGGKRRGRPPGSGAAAPAKAGRGGRRRRKRRSFSMNGEESVLGFVQKHGKPNAAEVNKHWKGEGRGGKADNALSKLVRDGKLKRIPVKGERGGLYAMP
jgi:hypothetical protein